tara:strand:+ start:379 stop:540 length:162 start_codon:yes stop_codon:yes gene_type:complete
LSHTTATRKKRMFDKMLVDAGSKDGQLNQSLVSQISSSIRSTIWLVKLGLTFS